MVDRTRPAGPSRIADDSPAAAHGYYKPGPSLGRVRAGRNVLRLGLGGEGVRELQRLLNEAGANPPLVRDGLFGVRTRAAVRALQSSAGIAVDGVVGQETLEVLDRGRAFDRIVPGLPNSLPPVPSAASQLAPGLQPPSRPAAPSVQPPRPATSTVAADFAPEPGRVTEPFAGERGAREAQAAAILEANLRANDAWPPREGRIYVIQIDQDSPPPSASRADRDAYLDTYTGETVVFQARGDRLVELTDGPLRSAAHPGRFTGDHGVDINGDGLLDIAHLHTGVYEYNTAVFCASGRRRINSTQPTLPVARDTNRDGVINDERERQRHPAQGIQIHESGERHNGSAGCQTLPPRDFDQLQRAVQSGSENVFTYVLVRRPNDSFGEHRF